MRALVVCGVSTSGCVLSTVRDATERGWVVSVVADACADAAPGVHDVLVQNVLPLRNAEANGSVPQVLAMLKSL